MVSSFLLLVTAFNVAHALVLVHDHDSINRRYVDQWYQPDHHPVHALFKRAPAGSDGLTYPQVGTDAWAQKYPAGGVTPDVDHTPKEWLDQLKLAQNAGKIPNIPQSTLNNGSPAYANMDAGGPEICSSTYQCRSPDDVYDGPEGYFAISFDDGPLSATPTLVGFLQKNNETGTHFMIGSNVLANPNQFLAVFNYGGDCAVHTWTHPYMTTLTNEQIVAELGWTMQIIHDSSGGRVPKVWRPPYGDSDKRVRAIAKEVFGMTTVIWNQDTDDWSISSGKQTLEGIDKQMDGWLSGPKTTGLVILEHELSDQTVQAFMNNFPKVKSNGWKTASLARIIGGAEPYQNVQGDTVAPASVYLVNGTSIQSSTQTSSTSRYVCMLHRIKY
ncbi:glycoside hydrolase/deacetylase [Marasmius fiardii PR-910]|nr:glycoside hydrolase/deacetylase [Marasmius fiardii PR-910]